jgi:hypothetical protein
MAICYVRTEKLCAACAALGVGEEAYEMSPAVRAVELNDVCTPCVKHLRTAYVGVVNHKKDQVLLDKVAASSSWCRSHEWRRSQNPTPYEGNVAVCPAPNSATE